VSELDFVVVNFHLISLCLCYFAFEKTKKKSINLHQFVELALENLCVYFQMKRIKQQKELN
jgi:hypothetical protein